MDEGTGMGLRGAGRSFPTTRGSVLEALGNPDEGIRRRAVGNLVEVYWKPVYMHLRLRWQLEAEDAKDLTQEFFLRAMEPGFFAGYDSARARFRTFLKTCLDHFTANAKRAERRLKRGGGAVVVALDFGAAEQELQLGGTATEQEIDARFHQEWVRALFTRAVAGLQGECRGSEHEVRFRLFERYDLEPTQGQDRPSYRALGDEFGLPVTQVTNHLAWARREFRRHVLTRLRELAGSEAEFRAEARDLLGVDPE